jgi:type II secretory pathway predicted ATPase ExeA
MYESYFNLSARPFGTMPRTDRYYPAASMEAARTTLARAIERGEGVGVVIGPAGIGKTLLCQLLAAQFKSTFSVALLGTGRLGTCRALLQSILYELGQPYRGLDEGELRLSLVEHLTTSGDCPGGIADSDCPQGMLLLVDEAHTLPLRMLEEIRTLTNLSHQGQPRVRLVLAGDRILEERFASPKLDSFNQRVIARCYLDSLNRTETQEYIHTHIAAAGGKGPRLIPAETCQSVYKATDGVPRLINQVCDHALLLACARGARQLEPAHVEEAWADLQQLPTPGSEPSQPSDNVIEFGGLEDEPAEAPPPAAALPAGEFEPAVFEPELPEPEALEPADLESAALESAELEPAEQLHQIEEMLADVEQEFCPASSHGRELGTVPIFVAGGHENGTVPFGRTIDTEVRAVPELELLSDEPAHPFQEPFQEEEVIADRYVGPRRERSESAAGDREGSAASQSTVSPIRAQPAPPLRKTASEPATPWAAPWDAQSSASADVDWEPSDEDPLDATADLDEDAAGLTNAVVPVERHAYKRLFAKLIAAEKERISS